MVANTNFVSPCFKYSLSELVKLARSVGIDVFPLKKMQSNEQTRRTWLCGKIEKRFIHAVEDDQFNIVNLLLPYSDLHYMENPEERLDVVNRLLELAIYEGRVDVVDRLLQHPRINPAAGEDGAIIVASREGHYEVVDRLLQDKRVDPAAQNNWAIVYASNNGHLDVVNRLLQDKRVNPADRWNHAIINAIRNGHREVVKRLLDDPRVEWRNVIGTPYENLLDERKQKLVKSLLPILGVFREKVPGKEAALALGSRYALEQGRLVLCKDLQDGSIPSAELEVLLDMLYRAKYISKEDWERIKQSRDKKEVCEAVKRILRHI